MAKWRFYDYDVWGRGSDAWVNDVFSTNLVLDLPHNPPIVKIVDAIKRNMGDKVEIDNHYISDTTVYLNHYVTYTDEDTGKIMHDIEPYGEIRREA